MDLALAYNKEIDGLDLSIDPVRADLAQDETLTTATVLSLLCDRLAEPGEVPVGVDRRGWWADALAEDGDRIGSRLWLLAREKQIDRTLHRARVYLQESLDWLVADGLATKVDVAVFAPRIGYLVAHVVITVDGESRRYRFEWSDDSQVWRLAGEVF